VRSSETVGIFALVTPLSALDHQTIRLIRQEYRRATAPWFVGFSGGKDSSAVTKLLFYALRRETARRPVTLVYCDTGVEIPIVHALVVSTLRRLKVEASRAGVPFRVCLARPKLKDRYFVRVIGKGYPPPTNKFRWCTDRLRIAPVQRVLRKAGEGGVVLLGIRRGESPERDKTIRALRMARSHFLRQEGASCTVVFAPIINYSIDDVWSTLAQLPEPQSIDARRLAALYRQASGECPVIREPTGTPCSKGRFGCWTCTVVRRDRSMEGLVGDGHNELRPLLAFRNWLQAIRDLPGWRCGRRRNGGRGPGPFTLEARRRILSRLIRTQAQTRWRLVTAREITAIRAYWRLDTASAAYRKLEKGRGQRERS
jgi:DNA sulfur modification protein DndC